MTGILFATQVEAAPFLGAYERGRFEGLGEGDTLFDDKLFVSLMGQGKIKATLRTERFLQNHHPERIIHVGTCTALNKKLHVGEVVAANQVFEGNHIKLATPIYPRLPLEVPFEDIATGTLVTQDYTRDHPVDKTYWQRIADISDMTGYAVAYVAAMHGIPCYIAKAISGHYGSDSELFVKDMKKACKNACDFLQTWIQRR